MIRLVGCNEYETGENQRLDPWEKYVFAWILLNNWSNHYKKSLKLWGKW